ncbi:hypothetical protein [Brevifollis gellanilyticus]|nr:hypothetical protein [Brevifollis gellanilyticus]
MKIENITFCHSLTLGPLCDGGRVAFTIEPGSPASVGPGVYVVFEDEKIVYIGSYQSGVAKRWLYLRKQDVYHFKKPLVADSLSRGAILKVFAQDERDIKEQLGCGDNVWVNSAGIEARLISIFHPPWNNQGKKAPLVVVQTATA